MPEQLDNLVEKAKRVDIAMKYTAGDIEKAKAMAAGQYLDIVVVKGKFVLRDRGWSGLLIAFFNTIDEYIASIDTILFTTTEIFEKVRIFDDWKVLHSDFAGYKQREDIMDSAEFTGFLLDSFISYDVFPDVQERDLDKLTKVVTEIIGNSFNDRNVQCQVEVEQSTSLNLELAGIGIDVPGSLGPKKDDKGKAGPAGAYDERIEAIESEAEYVITGKVIVAPVRGKYINDIEVGDKVKINLPGEDVISRKILKVLNAYDTEGNKLPIKGRVKAKIPLEKTGYILYALVAKGVLAKIIEEENVKILLDNPEEERLSQDKMDNRLFIYIAVLVLLIIICGLTLFMLL